MGRTVFTTITPIPAGVSRETVLETLHDHIEMIDLNPTHESRNPIKPPPEASPEEYHCSWYQITDIINYMPAGLLSGKVHFKACFHNLPMGLQTHCYAPLGLDIKEKWTLGGTLPHEPAQPVEIGLGAPLSGLYLREDVEMKCNVLMAKFVKKQLKDALVSLVARLVVKSQLVEAANRTNRITLTSASSPQPSYAQVQSPSSPYPSYANMQYDKSQEAYPNQAQAQAQGNNVSYGRASYSQQQSYHGQQYPQQYQQQPQHQQSFAMELDATQQPYSGQANCHPRSF